MLKCFTVFVQKKPRQKKFKYLMWFYDFDGARVECRAKDQNGIHTIVRARLSPIDYDLVFLDR